MDFSELLIEILKKNFPNENIHNRIKTDSHLIRYLIIKTKSANRGSKSRGSFANLYALVVLLEDYVNKGFQDPKKNYLDYEGAIFSELLVRMRELPFGQKLQNHALNNRLNDEFRKYFPDINEIPIIRNLETKRYWLNEELIYIEIDSKRYSLINSIIEIILKYVEIRQERFNTFIDYCKHMSENATSANADNEDKIKEFILNQLNSHVDARIFEIVSFSILKYYYLNNIVYWGWDPEELVEENLKLYKTGRTNANDGGIDFVMKPLGRFYQVTETLDFKKYFLDIDKIQRYPIVFVIKSTLDIDKIEMKIRMDAKKIYKISSVIESYISCFEEIINIPKLHEILNKVSDMNRLKDVLSEIELQTQVEFNLVTA